MSKTTLTGQPNGRHTPKNLLTLVAIVVAELSAVARVVAVDNISGLGLRNEISVGLKDVVLVGYGTVAIVHEEGNVLIGKAMDILQVLDHVEDIVVASRELSRGVADVVDADEEGAPRASCPGGNDLEGGLNVEGAGGGELGDLGVVPGEVGADGHENLLEAQVPVRLDLVGV